MNFEGAKRFLGIKKEATKPAPASPAERPSFMNVMEQFERQHVPGLFKTIDERVGSNELIFDAYASYAEVPEGSAPADAVRIATAGAYGNDITKELFSGVAEVDHSDVLKSAILEKMRDSGYTFKTEAIQLPMRDSSSNELFDFVRVRITK